MIGFSVKWHDRNPAWPESEEGWFLYVGNDCLHKLNLCDREATAGEVREAAKGEIRDALVEVEP